MKFIRGSAVRFNSEVETVTGTTVTLTELLDPNGDTILSDEAMSFDTVNTSVAFTVWQSLVSSVLGKYTYKIKATNGSYSDIDSGSFYLKDS